MNQKLQQIENNLWNAYFRMEIDFFELLLELKNLEYTRIHFPTA